MTLQNRFQSDLTEWTILERTADLVILHGDRHTGQVWAVAPIKIHSYEAPGGLPQKKEWPDFGAGATFRDSQSAWACYNRKKGTEILLEEVMNESK